MNWIELEGGGILVAKCSEVEVATVGKGLAARVSTEILDTDGDIVHAEKNADGPGWELDSFNRRPFLTWMHDKKQPNITDPSVRAHVRKRGDMAGAALYLDPFAFDPGDPFAVGIQGKYERRVLTDTSVGFTSKNWKAIATGREYFGQTLIEVAAVNIGANQETDVMVKSMLGRTGMIERVEAAGDSEVEAMKVEVQYLREELRLISNVVKLHGDKIFVGQDARDAVEPRAQLMEATIKSMADTLLARLQKIGTAQ